jgi:hypothetical protein
VIEQEVSRFTSSNVSQVYHKMHDVIRLLGENKIADAQAILKELLLIVARTNVHDIDRHFALYGIDFMSKINLMKSFENTDETKSFIGSIVTAYKEFHTPGTYGHDDKGGYPHRYWKND